MTNEFIELLEQAKKLLDENTTIPGSYSQMNAKRTQQALEKIVEALFILKVNTENEQGS